MAVSEEIEWVLVACGLIAHADGVLDGAEVDRLMTMVDDMIPAEDYAEWLAAIGDKDELELRYAALPNPPAERHRVLLEEAWTMAMVDGERATMEVVVLAQIAERFGVDPMQLQFWREAWAESELEFARRVTELAVASLAGEEILFEDDHSPFLDLIERLPTSTEQRDQLRRLATSPVEHEVLARGLAAIPRTRRRRAFLMVAPLLALAVERDAAVTRFVEIGRAAGLLDVDELVG